MSEEQQHEKNEIPSLLSLSKAIGILNQIPQDGIKEYYGVIQSQMTQEGSFSVVEIKVIFEDGTRT